MGNSSRGQNENSSTNFDRNLFTPLCIAQSIESSVQNVKPNTEVVDSASRNF